MNGHTMHSVTLQNSSRATLIRASHAFRSMVALSQVSISGLADENSSRKTQLESSGTTQTAKDFSVSENAEDRGISAKIRNGPVNSRALTAP